MREFAAAMVVGFCAVLAGGCSGQCGVGIPEGALNVNDGGYEAFSGVPVGTSATTVVPIQDSANVGETVTGSSLTGNDAAAFKVLSTFPMSLPAGTIDSVTVEFTPQHFGTSTATLVLDTQNMGPSPIPLQGTAY